MRRKYRLLTRLSLGMAMATAPLGLVVAAPAAPASASTSYTIDAGQLAMTLDNTGTVTNLVNVATGVDYASGAHHRSLIQLVANGAQQVPTALSYNSTTSTYDFTFGGISTDVYVQVAQKTNYATLDVTSLNAPANVDVSTLMWGPITTSITKTVGEAAGVVYDNNFAIGIHELNNKTIGGWVNEYDNLSYNDPTYATPMPFDSGSAARTSWGSILQAYTYDATTARTRGAGVPGTSLWMPDQPMPSLSGPDGQIVGSEIALFGAATPNVLSTISGIETGEGLIHPTINGQWQKTAQSSSQSFLVLSDLNTGNVAQASQYAQQAGINYIYSLTGVNGPWVSNGHFGFNSAFGGSDSAVASMVGTAAGYGIKVGVHTLSDFIDPNDPYITPTPDAGLVKGGSATLTRPLDTSSTDIYVSTNTPFTNSLGKYLQIGSEIADFTTITQISANEWDLSGGTRAIWGTTAAIHNTGDTVARLIGNEYGGLVGGIPIINNISTRLASIFNTTGLKAMSFDGMESASQAGYGTYPTNLMINGMYGQLNSTDGFISEASNLLPNTWDAQTRISWGEQGSTSMVQRYNNMSYATRNFLPAMIGWLSLNSSQITTEYNLSKMAAWNAGCGFQTSVSALGAMDPTARAAVLDSITQWETARNLGAFTPLQKSEMQNLNTYWHLSVVTPGSRWSLQQITSAGANVGSPQAVFVGNTDPKSDPDLALTATATASSEYNGSYLAGNAVDGVTGVDGYGEWASKGELNPSLRLDWTSAQTINKVTFYDRPNLTDWAPGGTLTFSDGSTVKVTGIPNDGTPYSVTFPDRTVTSLTFQVSGGSGSNVGLSEIQVFHANPDTALSATASASSVLNSNYSAGNAIDGVTGQDGTGEWASNGELDPWLRLDWTSAQTINKVTFYDRPNLTDWAPGGTLTFSDGSTVSVSGIPNDGTPYSVTFPAKTVTSLTFQVSGGSDTNVGLSEIQAFDDPDLALNATASASSSYDSRYVPGNAVDGITGQNGVGEWASKGELDPWLRLDWTSGQTIDRVVFYDRPNLTDWAPGGTLTFSDGSTVNVSGIPNDGTPYTVTFPARTASSLTFQVAGGSGTNVGLSELEAFND